MRYSFFRMLLFILPMMLTGCSDDEVVVRVYQVSPGGIGAGIGTVKVLPASGGGIRLVPDLHDLEPGDHGFHVHENGSCEAGEKGGKKIAAFAAGGHYDPKKTGRHSGPEGNGHLGDLPVLDVDDRGFAVTPVVAKRLTMADMKGRTLMIHSGGDNYSDNPPMGGGGARIACGVIPD
ncbi:superoxide dismutase [Endozoicomonas sp. OPT23]|uniref:superoxide dismutase family protein n=1 Tax=Endozoicomonas sp. OPT23 TaxID=2072845 RepID=UPI00129A99B7|nr:superoxide dismutase family protein [Endozoicomonas sp. OPT23]MRI32294.1 superoxide dismutase [Endozoicomonas sp. OPT23]